MTRTTPTPRTPPTQDLDCAVEVLRLLADRTRLAVLAMLAGTEMPVTSIARALERPTPAISQHLAKLRAAGLVVARREGTTVHYGQPDEHLAALVENVLAHAEHVLYAEPPHHRAATWPEADDAPNLPSDGSQGPPPRTP